MVPSLFLAHGSPMIAIQNNEYTKALKEIGENIKPKAIVLFSAHFEEHTTTIGYTDTIYETIYDFGGFPKELYDITYPAKGSKEIATIVSERLKANNIPTNFNPTRGLDHGSWTLLKHMYPDANIPVVQVSVNPALPAKDQYEIGKALKGLGEEDILVIGSGALVHNLRILKWNQTTPDEWAVEFDEWIIEKIQNQDLNALFNWENEAPHARLAVPREEHFVPLFIALGSGQLEPKWIYRGYELGNLSYLSFAF